MPFQKSPSASVGDFPIGSVADFPIGSVEDRCAPNLFLATTVPFSLQHLRRDPDAATKVVSRRKPANRCNPQRNGLRREKFPVLQLAPTASLQCVQSVQSEGSAAHPHD